MRLALPWWASPWRLRHERDVLAHLCDRLTEREADLTGECARLRGQLVQSERLLRKADQDIDELRSQLHQARGSLHTATDHQQPEFVLVGIDRGPGLGKRLIASRDLPGAELAMTEMTDPPPRWVIRAVLARPLFIDRASYGQALEHMRQVWANWDAGARPADRESIEPPARGAIEP